MVKQDKPSQDNQRAGEPPQQAWGFTQQAATAPVGGVFIHLPLGVSNTADIRFREKLSGEEFEALLQIMKLSRPSLVDPGKSDKKDGS